jgi:FAD-dependent oxidoreductase domain-containing protein 1
MTHSRDDLVSKSVDIIIAKGGVMGSSIANNLLNDGKIIVFEKDPIYEFSSTATSVGGIRQLFPTAVNIEMGET